MDSHRRRRLRRKFQVFYARHHRTFWVLHSIWALVTGAVVVVVSHEKYGFAGWVMGFLVLTWVSTFFFSRLAEQDPDSPKAMAGHEIASYLTRIMYQETLFFLLPFYYTSASWPSWNMLFVVLLAVLAALSCLDLVFDDLLRRHHAFGLTFFAVVAFASFNFLLPTLFGTQPEIATPLSAAIGLGAALPLVYEAGDFKRWKTAFELGGAAVAIGLFLWLGRGAVPPVPLKLADLTFSADVERSSLEPVTTLEGSASIREAGLRQVAAVARIFAPRSVPTHVVMHWNRNGSLIDTSREVEIAPHEHGFRVWDILSVEGGLTPGPVTVEVWTLAGQLIGRSRLELSE